MAQQVSALQTIKLIKQPRGSPSTLKTEEGIKDYHIFEYLKNLGFLSKEEIERDYPVKPFQRPRPQRNNVSTRIDRVEEGINETRDAVNQLTNQFQKLNIHKCDICGETGHNKGSCPKQIVQSNFNRSYFKPFTPINPQYASPDSNDDNGGGCDEDNNWWTGYNEASEKKTGTSKRVSTFSASDRIRPT